MNNICVAGEKNSEGMFSLTKSLSKYRNSKLIGPFDPIPRDTSILIAKRVNEEQLKDALSLKAIFAYKTGVDSFDLEALAKRHIALYNSHAATDLVAQYAFALAISLVSQIPLADHYLRDGIWASDYTASWRSLFGMKVGLVGFGHIGRGIAEILADNHIPFATIERPSIKDKNIRTFASISLLADYSDILIASLPETSLTKGVFNKDIFSHMKGKYFVDVGRSSDIVLEDLYDALKNRTLEGAAIDGWVTSPVDRSDKLLPSSLPFEKLPNIIMSPHVAAKAEVGEKLYLDDVLDNVVTYLKTGKARNLVDLNKGY